MPRLMPLILINKHVMQNVLEDHCHFVNIAPIYLLRGVKARQRFEKESGDRSLILNLFYPSMVLQTDLVQS